MPTIYRWNEPMIVTQKRAAILLKRTGYGTSPVSWSELDKPTDTPPPEGKPTMAEVTDMVDTSVRSRTASVPSDVQTAVADWFAQNEAELVGPMGPAGATGDTGPVGPSGVKGDQGPLGPRGSDGLNGKDGNQGIPGVPGNPGPQGPPGERGPAGVTGDQGIQGVAGPPGPRGAQGDQGPRGDTGPQGVPGTKGDPGVKGDQGIQGAKGDTGAQGLKGDTGPQGIQGVKGDTGATGAKGADGSNVQLQSVTLDLPAIALLATAPMTFTWPTPMVASTRVADPATYEVFVEYLGGAVGKVSHVIASQDASKVVLTMTALVAVSLGVGKIKVRGLHL